MFETIENRATNHWMDISGELPWYTLLSSSNESKPPVGTDVKIMAGSEDVAWFTDGERVWKLTNASFGFSTIHPAELYKTLTNTLDEVGVDNYWLLPDARVLLVNETIAVATKTPERMGLELLRRLDWTCDFRFGYQDKFVLYLESDCKKSFTASVCLRSHGEYHIRLRHEGLLVSSYWTNDIAQVYSMIEFWLSLNKQTEVVNAIAEMIAYNGSVNPGWLESDMKYILPAMRYIFLTMTDVLYEGKAQVIEQNTIKATVEINDMANFTTTVYVEGVEVYNFDTASYEEAYGVAAFLVNDLSQGVMNRFWKCQLIEKDKRSYFEIYVRSAATKLFYVFQLNGEEAAVELVTYCQKRRKEYRVYYHTGQGEVWLVELKPEEL